MQKQLLHYVIPTTGMIVKGNVFAVTQLSAKFQIWCRDVFGISEDQSLALWLSGTYQNKFTEEGQIERLAAEALKLLPNIKEIILE